MRDYPCLLVVVMGVSSEGLPLLINSLVLVHRYSFVYGSVQIIMMSTEHDFQVSSKQYSALVSYFEAVNRTRTPWLIFSGHRSADFLEFDLV